MGGHYQPLGYGQVDLINYWAAHGLPGPHWLMGSTWRSSSQFAGHEVGSPHVALVQSHDAAGNWLRSPVAGTDINTVTQPGRLPAWWPPGSPYARHTLSASIWDLEKFRDGQPISQWSVGHLWFVGILGLLFLWLFFHFALGWWRS
jgi:hypothetical protein